MKRLTNLVLHLQIRWMRHATNHYLAVLLAARKANDLEFAFTVLRRVRRFAGPGGAWWTAVLLAQLANCGAPRLTEGEYAGFQVQRRPIGSDDDDEFVDVDVELIPAPIRVFGRFTTAILNRDIEMTQTVWAPLDRIEENLLLTQLLDMAWTHIDEFHEGKLPDGLK